MRIRASTFSGTPCDAGSGSDGHVEVRDLPTIFSLAAGPSRRGPRGDRAFCALSGVLVVLGVHETVKSDRLVSADRVKGPLRLLRSPQEVV